MHRVARLHVLVDVLEHAVDRRDRLGVDLVGALGFDHIDHFLDHIDVGGLQSALHQGAGAIGSGGLAPGARRWPGSL